MLAGLVIRTLLSKDEMQKPQTSRLVSSAMLAASLALPFTPGCAKKQRPSSCQDAGALKPRLITESVEHDPDDPAIWLHPGDRAQSLVLGTDKGNPGAIYVYDLNGKIIPDKTVDDLPGPNNVDVEYGFALNGATVDIAVATLQEGNQIRVFRLPDMQALDGGGLAVFAAESRQRARPMGIALYRRPADGSVFAIVSRKSGPREGYLWQYLLQDDGAGKVQALKVREFGQWSGSGEIEAIAVDDALGHVYYADERFGIRKYCADPAAAGAQEELAVFGTTGFKEDREGISIYPTGDSTGYILVSNQQANAFHVYKREGEPGEPHRHALLTEVKVCAKDSDGSEVTNAALNAAFPAGLFVAMSDDRTFHFYSWADLAGGKLLLAPDGRVEGK